MPCTSGLTLRSDRQRSVWATDRSFDLSGDRRDSENDRPSVVEAVHRTARWYYECQSGYGTECMYTARARKWFTGRGVGRCGGNDGAEKVRKNGLGGRWSETINGASTVNLHLVLWPGPTTTTRASGGAVVWGPRLGAQALPSVMEKTRYRRRTGPSQVSERSSALIVATVGAEVVVAR